MGCQIMMRQSIPLYTIERVREIKPYDDVHDFCATEGPHVENMFHIKYEFAYFDFFSYARNHLVWVCRKKKKPVGILLARLYPSIFDPTVMILMQDLLYCKKSSGRAAHLLLSEFIDFGRVNANLVFTMITKSTNVKGRSLERLGFMKTEELYRLEV